VELSAAAARSWVPGPTPEGVSRHALLNQAAFMMWLAIIAVIGLPTIVLIAWVTWLTFAMLMAKWHGIDGLKAVPNVGAGFRPAEWASLGSKPRLASGELKNGADDRLDV
jgi:hypothetical protein